MDANFGFPETNTYKAACMVEKSRRSKTGEGFEACAAIFFNGIRVAQAFATGASRARAITAAKRALSGVRNAIEQPIGATICGLRGCVGP